MWLNGRFLNHRSATTATIATVRVHHDVIRLRACNLFPFDRNGQVSFHVSFQCINFIKDHFWFEMRVLQCLSIKPAHKYVDMCIGAGKLVFVVNLHTSCRHGKSVIPCDRQWNAVSLHLSNWLIHGHVQRTTQQTEQTKQKVTNSIQNTGENIKF